MKILLIAATAAAFAMPAMAQTSPNGIVLTNTEEMAEGFDNYGQCQSTFRQLRNDQRKSGLRGGEPYDSMDNGEYNGASRDTTRCEQLDDDRYYVVFNAEGF
ncbi:MAG TPA: hypothetical protein VFT40_13685 [Sphingomicrobium sp.]|nr:hypothetical protein [Sphingomicrobium sp.]